MENSLQFIMHIKSNFLFLIVVVCFTFSSCTNTNQNSKFAQVEDGFYLIKRVDSNKNALKPLNENEVLIPYNAKYTGDAEEEQEYVVLNSVDFVPMTLKEKPEALEQEDKRKNLLLKLDDAGAKRLEEFTGEHLEARVGIVVGSEVLTMHVIRAKITGGLMQITRCTDNACEFLFLELEDNVVN